MKNTDDIYEILQVHHAAEPEVIEAAYRRLLRMYHPDVNKASEAHEITVRLNTAYEVLRDPGKRANYDRERTSQTRHDYRQQEQQAHGERQRREQEAQTEREHRARAERKQQQEEERAERQRQEYREWERQAQAQAQARAEQEREKQRERLLSDRLFQAVMDLDIHMVRTLISEGANLNAKEYDNSNTPLHLAVGMQNAGILSELIANGANVNAQNIAGRTPLHHVASGNRTDLLLQLISNGADVNARDDYGETSSTCGGSVEAC